MSLKPGTPEWARVVTASKVAAILGHSPFMSQRSVWHLMRCEWTPPVTDAMMRGNYLEDGVLAWWSDQNPDYGMRQQPSYTLGDWAAATPDGYAQALGLPDVLVEAKTSANDDEWGRPGTDEIPTHYLTQCYWSMHVSGIHEIRVPVLTSRLVFAEYVVLHDVGVGNLLEARCREFYDSLWTDPTPPLDDSVSTFECMRRLHADIDPKAEQDIPADLAREFIAASLDEKAAEARSRKARIAIYDLSSRAQYLTCNGVTVARRQASPNGGVSIVRVAKRPDDIPESDVA